MVGERWQVGDAVLQVRGPRIPCRVFAGFRGVPDLVKRFTAAGRPGAYLAVERPGRARAGDEVRVLDRPVHGVTTAHVMAAMMGERDRVLALGEVREYLGVRGRDWLDRTLAAMGA
ncbi:MOSC domain-containing protein [Pseudonocardia nigra]|uniref:MOSC domain-containing protein n=1 Tax=Pseudonocardia nigra TaxID=1921578 RepID=UPI0035576AC9